VPQADQQSRIEDAKCLLRVVRQESDIDSQTKGLSKGNVSLKDLMGFSDTRNGDGAPRSMSTMMLCNQPAQVLIAAASKLSKTEGLRNSAMGAAAVIIDIDSIDFEGLPAFEVSPEEEPEQPGHVSIRFSQRDRMVDDKIRDCREFWGVRATRAFSRPSLTWGSAWPGF
jgi:hypothetical protein